MSDAPAIDDLNVDEFCKDTAKALLMLYRVFPRPHTVFVDDLCGAEETDEFGMHSDRYLGCFSTLLWLAEEGLLRYSDTIRQEAIDQAVLTGRAFTLLATPGLAPCHDAGAPADDTAPLQFERPTHLYRLQAALQQRSSPALRSAVLDLLNALSGMRRA